MFSFFISFGIQSLENEAVMIRFQNVYDKLSQAFNGVPCDELGISDEVKEQVHACSLIWRHMQFFIYSFLSNSN